jgi:hypothetical protein
VHSRTRLEADASPGGRAKPRSDGGFSPDFGSGRFAACAVSRSTEYRYKHSVFEGEFLAIFLCFGI